MAKGRRVEPLERDRIATLCEERVGPDEAIACVAASQHGRVAWRQLVALGITRKAIEVRRARGTLREVHRGVYAVGHAAPAREADWQAAVLAGGAGAVLSHLSAGELWELLSARRGPVHVSSARHRRNRRGIILHRASLPAREVAVHRGIAVTTVPRTMLDLAAYLARTELRRLIRECEYRSLATIDEIEQVLDRYPRRRGRARLREALASVKAAPGYTRSVLEEEFLSLVAELRLPSPELNAIVILGDKRIEVDCLWRAQRIVVELDGGQAHKTESAFEDDRRRDRALVAAGITPLRVTWTSLRAERTDLSRDLQAALTRKDGGSGP